MLDTHLSPARQLREIVRHEASEVNLSTLLVDQKQMVETGTVIFGFRYQGGLILAADAQTSLGSRKVGHRDSKKIHRISDFSAVGGSGAVTFIQMLLDIYNKVLALYETRAGATLPLTTQRKLFVEVMRRFYLQTGISAYFLFGGLSPNGKVALGEVDAGGGWLSNNDILAATGSGWMEAKTVLGGHFKRTSPEETSLEEALRLAWDALDFSSNDKGVGHPDVMPPTIAQITADEGLTFFENEEILAAVGRTSK